MSAGRPGTGPHARGPLSFNFVMRFFRQCLLCVSVALSIADYSAASPPNIVFILTDNQTAGALPVYGNRDVRTPHIDQLAREGVRFDRAYAASGMCSPNGVR